MVSLLARIEELFRPIALRGFEACAEAIIPENDLGAPLAADTELVARADRWWQRLPPESRRLMLLLYTAMELGAPLLVPSLRPLSRLPVATRLRLLERWRGSRLGVFHFLADAVKSPVVMMYLSHPKALQWLGATTCEHPFEARQDLTARAPFPPEAAS